MITGIAFALILIAVVCQGGDLRRLATIRPRHMWLVAGAIWLQIGVFTLFGSRIPFAVATVLHMASYGFAMAFVVVNRRIRGVLLLVLGGLLNFVAIAANGGMMPATEAALEFAGKAVHSSDFENSGVQDQPRLQFLGDVFAFPAGMPYANVFSVGDIVLVIGGYVLVSRACKPQYDPVRRTGRGALSGMTDERRPELHATNVHHVVRAAVEVMSLRAGLASVEIRHAGSRSEIVDVDPDRLHQVAVELLSHAVMSSSGHGAVSIIHEIVDGALLVTVASLGAGVDGPESLAVARRMVEDLEGDLYVQTSTGQGSTARVVLPNRLCRGLIAV